MQSRKDFWLRNGAMALAACVLVLAGAQAHSAAVVGDVKVARATGKNARTVAEVIKNAAALNSQTIVLHGKIVKYNPGIMGKNWLHLQDGSGVAGSNDILVTTQEEAKLGDVVTVSGLVRINQDFGAGYVYKVLIEQATLQK